MCWWYNTSRFANSRAPVARWGEPESGLPHNLLTHNLWPNCAPVSCSMIWFLVHIDTELGSIQLCISRRYRHVSNLRSGCVQVCINRIYKNHACLKDPVDSQFVTVNSPVLLDTIKKDYGVWSRVSNFRQPLQRACSWLLVSVSGQWGLPCWLEVMINFNQTWTNADIAQIWWSVDSWEARW